MRRDRTWSRVVGRNVRHHRHHLNLTQGEVARRLEQQGYRYSAVQISRLETWTPYVDGNVPIVSVDLLVCLAIALEVDAHDLLILDQKER